MNARGTANRESPSFQPFVKPRNESVAKWAGGWSPERSAKKERKKRDKPGTEKERRGCAREPKSPRLAKKRGSVLLKSVRAFRVWLRWALAPTTPSRRDGGIELVEYTRESDGERSSGGGMERETTLPSNPQSETTRRDDETLTEFSSDSRGAERETERKRERDCTL